MKNQARYKYGFKLYGHTAKNAGGGFGRDKRMKFFRKGGVDNWERVVNREYTG